MYPLSRRSTRHCSRRTIMRSAPIFSSTFWMNIILQTRPCGSLKRRWIGDATPSCLSMRQANADCLSQPTMMRVDVYWPRWPVFALPLAPVLGGDRDAARSAERLLHRYEGSAPAHVSQDI